MERLKSMKENLISCVQAQIGTNLASVDSKELGEAIDMIKDLEEAIYYCTITKAMDESKEEQKQMEKMKQQMPMYYTEPRMRMPYPDYYRDMDKEYGRMYYTDGGQGQGNSSMGSRGAGMSNTSDGQMNYEERPYPMMQMRDHREGRSPISRRHYMESKETHQGKEKQMHELEDYMKELSQDIVEMIQDATPEEKQVLRQKMVMLTEKIK